MLQLKEGTHYRIRAQQPSPALHKSKASVDCLFCSDPGNSDYEVIEHATNRKRSRPKGRKIRLGKLLHHMKK